MRDANQRQRSERAAPPRQQPHRILAGRRHTFSGAHVRREREWRFRRAQRVPLDREWRLDTTTQNWSENHRSRLKDTS